MDEDEDEEVVDNIEESESDVRIDFVKAEEFLLL